MLGICGMMNLKILVVVKTLTDNSIVSCPALGPKIRYLNDRQLVFLGM